MPHLYLLSLNYKAVSSECDLGKNTMKFFSLLFIPAVFAATIERGGKSLKELAEGRVEHYHWSRSIEILYSHWLISEASGWAANG